MRDRGPTAANHAAAPGAPAPDGWVKPTCEVIALDCEITAYAPDGDDPLF